MSHQNSDGNKPQGPGTGETNLDEHIVDFGKARAQKLEEKRRKTERIFFKQILGIYCVTENDKTPKPIENVDMSEDGCSFQVPFDSNDPWPRDLKDIPIRIYFSQDTYMPLYLQIQNSRSCIENSKRYTRYGCRVDKTITSYPAYRQFIQFLKLYSEHAHQDDGKVTLFYI